MKYAGFGSEHLQIVGNPGCSCVSTLTDFIQMQNNRCTVCDYGNEVLASRSDEEPVGWMLLLSDMVCTAAESGFGSV